MDHTHIHALNLAPTFDLAHFLACAGRGRRIVHCNPKGSLFSQGDSADFVFNSSERRLARLLLLMAEYGEPGEPTKFIPSITQETLAEMVGTTRSRVSSFMNCFRKLGFIDYNGRIQVHKSLLKAVLLNRLPEHATQAPRVAPQSSISPECSISKLCA